MAPAQRETRRLLGVAGRGRDAAARPCTEEERVFACAVALCTAPTDLKAYAAWRACAASARAAPPPVRERERICACATRGAVLAWRCRPRQERRSTAVHQRGEGPRWHSGLVYGAYRLQPTRRCARARQARVLRLLPRERESALAPAPRETRRLLVGGELKLRRCSRSSTEWFSRRSVTGGGWRVAGSR